MKAFTYVFRFGASNFGAGGIDAGTRPAGTKAKVELNEGSAKITTTDAQGKTSQMEMGSAKVTEADLDAAKRDDRAPAGGAQICCRDAGWA